jgi:TRAP-type C4-dicarboxylate transport system permease small subunit
MREVFIIGYPSFLEIIKLGFQAVIFFGVGAILAKPSVMRFELITSRLRGRSLRILEFFTSAFCSGFFIFLGIQFPSLLTATSKVLFPTLQIPLSWMYIPYGIMVYLYACIEVLKIICLFIGRGSE